jgi:hypothetical protein
MRAACKMLALVVHPENAECERRVRRGLSLLRIDVEHGKRRLAGAQHSPGINRAERMLKIGTNAEMLDFEAAIFAQQDAPKHALILASQQALQSAGAAVGIGADFQQLGLGLSKGRTLRRKVRPFTSALSTRRTVLRSSDHRCRMHFPSPERSIWRCRSRTVPRLLQ